MAFPKELLAEHENLVFDLRPHWVALLPSALWTVLVWAIAWVADRVAGDSLDSAASEGILVGVAAVAWFFLAVLPFLRWRFTNFVLTTDRLITRSGIIAKRSKEIPLERINDVAFEQGVIDRMLRAGDLLIESAGERGQNRIGNVRHPEQVQLAIYKETEENNNRMMRPGGGTLTGTRTGETVTEQLEALGRLREQGVLSDAEFESKKQELLKRL